MKKILVGIAIENRNATCDFCGEEKKECFKSPRGAKFSYLDKKTKWKGFISPHREVVDCEWKDEEVDIDICEDCVKQLANSIK